MKLIYRFLVGLEHRVWLEVRCVCVCVCVRELMCVCLDQPQTERMTQNTAKLGFYTQLNCNKTFRYHHEGVLVCRHANMV